MKNYISLGAGVQSSTMALMAAHGEIGPMPDGAIFADTQAEPAPVYRWLDWLEKRLPFPVHRVTAGDLRAAALRVRTSKSGRKYNATTLPYHVASDNKDGMVRLRQCTSDYKIVPIVRELRRLVIPPRKAASPVATQWLGISLDEMNRIKPSRNTWLVNRWPLIELRLTRVGCIEWMKRRDYPEPPRSACTFCPYRSNREWRWLRNNDPAGFADAVDFDRKIRECDNDVLLGTLYIHSSRVPLGAADIRSDEERGQMLMWQDECTGMCGL
jgi:hypothetical protein